MKKIRCNTNKKIISIGIILLVFLPFAQAFTRYVTREFKFVSWFIHAPSSPSTTPLVDISGNGTYYAVSYIFGGAGSKDFLRDDSEFEAVRRALSEYQNTPGCALRFQEQIPSATSAEVKMGIDKHNMIFWDDTGATVPGGNIPDEQIALTVLSFNPATGELLDADIRFNGQDYTWVTAEADGVKRMDIYSVALHEIGYLTGLDASLIDTSAMGDHPLRPAMFPLRSGDPLRTGLTADDRAGLCRIYPAAGYENTVGSISGTLYRSDGVSEIYGAQVTAVDVGTGDPVASAITGSGALAEKNGTEVNIESGKYTIYGLPPGRYYVTVNPLIGGSAGIGDLKSDYAFLSNFQTDFLYEFFNIDDSAADNPADKTPITVQAGEKLTGVNIITNNLTHLNLRDQDSKEVVLQYFTFPFYGKNYDRLYVNSNGNITFNSPSTDGTETIQEFLAAPPRIAAIWDDLNPEAYGANISVIQTENEVTIIYTGVPEYPSRGASTFTVTLSKNGKIVLHFGVVSSLDDGIVGISPGLGGQSSELDFTSYRFSIPFNKDLPIFQQFFGSGDDLSDPGFDDPFDLDGAMLTFTPNPGGGYTLSYIPGEYFIPTPTPSWTPTQTPNVTMTPTPGITPTATPTNYAPVVILDPTTAVLELGQTLIVSVTATDVDGQYLIDFTDSPLDSGTFSSLAILGPGLTTITYTYQATFNNGGYHEIAISTNDTIVSGSAILSVTVNVPITPTPTYTPKISPTPTYTVTPTPNPNRLPTITTIPDTLALIVGETKILTLSAKDEDKDMMTLSDIPAGVGKFINTSGLPGQIYSDYSFTAKAEQVGEWTLTIQVSDGKGKVNKEIPIRVYPEGTTPSPTPSPTGTRTPTFTPTNTKIPTKTPTPTPTTNLPPVITLDPNKITLEEGSQITVSLTAGDPNRDPLDLKSFTKDDPHDILAPQTFSHVNYTIKASYLFKAIPANRGIHKVTFTVAEMYADHLTGTAIFIGEVIPKATPTQTPIPQGDIVVAQGEGGSTFVHRRMIPGVQIAPNSAFNAMPAAFAASLQCPATRAVYISTGDINHDGYADIVTSFGPYNPVPGTYPSIIVVRDTATKRVIGHSFNAFPMDSHTTIDNPFGEVRTAVGHFIPGKTTTQIAAAQGIGGHNVIRLFEYTGKPAPNGFQVVTQFTGLVAAAGADNQSGALTLAAGDLNTDGVDELVVGQTNSAASKTLFQIIRLDEEGKILFRSPTFQAFQPKYRGYGGVNLAVGDINGDLAPEIIAATMGCPDGVSIGENTYWNLVALIKPKLILTVIYDIERIANGIFNVFSQTENPSGAVNVGAGNLHPNPGAEVLFGTCAITTFDVTEKTLQVNYPAPVPKVRALRLQFTDGRFSGYSSLIANRNGTFQPFSIGFPDYSGSVNVAVREYETVSQGN